MVCPLLSPHWTELSRNLTLWGQQNIMKQTEKAPVVAGQDSSLPRFLRGLFRSHRSTQAPPKVDVIATSAVQVEAGTVESEEYIPTLAGTPKVLVVDDDPVFLKAMELKLSKAGCTVLTAHDGPEAIATARAANPSVIILDIGLPADISVAWDGIRVMQWIRRMENGSTPPIIIVTASTSPALKQSALDYGAAAFFQKPLDHAKLLEAIANVMEKWEPVSQHVTGPEANLAMVTPGT
jgi:CheY-like chemotaxis protein